MILEDEEIELKDYRQETCKEKKTIDRTAYDVNNIVNVKKLENICNELDKSINSIITKQIRKDQESTKCKDYNQYKENVSALISEYLRLEDSNMYSNSNVALLKLAAYCSESNLCLQKNETRMIADHLIDIT